MVTSQNTQRNNSKVVGGVNLGANVAQITDTNVKIKDQLPPDMQSDLNDSFEYFARGSEFISRSDFESIIHNFGFNRISQREKEQELQRYDNEYYRRTGFTRDFLEKIVNLRWYKGGGAQHEFLAAFKVFDRYERVFIKPSDLKQVFADYLDHPVTEQDIADIMAACDKNGSGSITFQDFKKFYNSC